MKEIKSIEIKKVEEGHLKGFYDVFVNGEILLECLSEVEVEEMTIQSIVEVWELLRDL